MTDIIVIEQINAVDVFTKPNGEDKILADLKKAFDQFTPDLTTAKGRKEIASYARKFSSSKAAMVAEHKKLVAKEKEKLKKIDAVKKVIVSTCDDYRDKTRQPLTDWENEEKSRIAKINESITMVKELRTFDTAEELTVDQLSHRLERAIAFQVDNSFGEMENTAEYEKDTAVSVLTDKIAAQVKHEEDQAKLAKLQKEADERQEKEEAEKKEREEKEAAVTAEQERKDLEEEIRKSAEEKAKREAEENAKVESQRVEREKAELVKKNQDEKARHELEKQEAILQAEAAESKRIADVAAAEKAERERIEAKQRAKKEEDRKRAEDKAHVDKINSVAAHAFCRIEGVGDAMSLRIVDAIAAMEVPAVKINY